MEVFKGHSGTVRPSNWHLSSTIVKSFAATTERVLVSTQYLAPDDALMVSLTCVRRLSMDVRKLETNTAPVGRVINARKERRFLEICLDCLAANSDEFAVMLNGEGDVNRRSVLGDLSGVVDDYGVANHIDAIDMTERKCGFCDRIA